MKEIYLWDDIDKEYYEIPLRNAYFFELKIDPTAPNNYPLSLEELKAIKQIQKTKTALPSKSSFSDYHLIEARKKRREIIENAQKKTKTAKNARKQKEIAEIHKDKATSTQIRAKVKKMEKDEANSQENLLQEEPKVDIEELKAKLRKKKFPTSNFPKKAHRGK